MKALSVRQPWASAIMAGAKQIENRSWLTHHRGPLAIHASQARADRDSVEECADLAFAYREDSPLGCVLGTVEVVGLLVPDTGRARAVRAVAEALGCSPSHAREALAWWDEDCFGWILARPRLLARPVPCKGALHLWRWEP